VITNQICSHLAVKAEATLIQNITDYFSMATLPFKHYLCFIYIQK